MVAAHLVDAQRGAVRRPRVLLVRGGPADDRPQRDEGRRLGVLPGGQEGPVERFDVLVVAAVGRAPGQPLHVPAVGLVPRADVLRLGDVRVILDRDRVVVVQHDEVPELLMTRERGRLVTDALLDIPVRDEAVDIVVEQAGPQGGVRVEQAVLAARAHGHADGVAEALAERPGGGLHAGREPVLGMPGRDAAPGAVALQVIERQPVPGQVELDVQGEAGMPAGQDETVSARPVGIGRVVPEQALVEQVGRRGQAHRRARVA